MHRISWTRGLAVLTAALVMSVAASAQAQNNSLFGGSSPTNGNNGLQPGSSTLGQNSGGGGLSLQSNALPSNALPGSSTQSAFGNTGNTGNRGQQSTFTGQRNTAFVGNAQANQNQTGMNNQFNNRQGQNRNNRGNQRNNQNNNQMGANATNQQSRTIRPQLHVAIDYTRPSLSESTTNAAASFDKVTTHPGLKGVTLEVDGSTVILRGAVDSAETRRLASALVRLEPGVRSIKNELTIGKPAAAPLAQ